MDITKDTKLKELLENHPQLKEKLAEINPKFKMMNTPMGKVMLGKATIADMSEKSGMDVNELIQKLSVIISSLK
jgi:hypothetical protein